MRAHVAEPRRFLEALNRPGLWNVIDRGASAAVPLKRRADRAVYAATIPVPSTLLGASDAPSTTKAETPCTPLPVVIKIFRARGVGDALQRLIRRTRGAREWHGLWRLHDANIAAASPYLLLRGRSQCGAGIELLVMQHVLGHDLLHAWAAGELEGVAGRLILERVGTQVAALMRASTPLFNRDHKPSNIIIDERGVPTMIDAAGVRPWRFQQPIAMLAKLWIETLGTRALHPELALPSRTQRWRVVRSYCGHALGGWVFATPVSRREQTKAAWRAASLLIQRHGDPTPQDDPLA